MTEKNLFEGADDYTDPAEIAQETGTEDPEASPISAAIGSFAASLAVTNTFGC